MVAPCCLGPAREFSYTGRFDERVTILAALTLAAYGAALLLIGAWASRRSRSHGDFLLGGRRLGPVIAAFSASASSSSAWTLVGVSSAAYAWGAAAIWLLPATLSGFAINWYLIAPRLQAQSAADGSLTLTEFILPASLGPARRWLGRLAAAMVLFAFVFYIASQFEAGARAVEVYFDWPRELGIIAGTALVLAYTLLGGFWAASVSDTLQGLAMVGAAVLLPIAGVAALGGPGPFVTAVAQLFATTPLAPGQAGWGAALAFGFGLLGIGFGYPGQPHVVNRFMAMADGAAIGTARTIAMTWAVAIYTGMLIVGWSARWLLDAGTVGDQVLFVYTQTVLAPVLAAIVLAAILSAIMSTTDSQLLVAASAVSHDTALGRAPRGGALAVRATVVVICVLAAALALKLPDDIFNRVLFAWHALGSAFGPLLVARLVGRHAGPWVSAATLCTGFFLTIVFNALPNTLGDWAERWVPLAVAGLIVALGSRPPK
ncbi:MAG: sodium/proline symporter [Pseudomonadota bacterium]